MTTIKLIRSGGLLGKPLQATHQIDIDEQKLIGELKAAAPVENRHARDNFHYSMVLNGGDTFPIDISLLSGQLQTIIEKMEDDLTVE